MIILLNPSAGGGTALRKWELLNKNVLFKNKELNVFLINGSVKTKELFQSAIHEGNYHFAAAGGDGTLNYLLNILLDIASEKEIKKLKIGAIGIGSSNDFHKPIKENQRINGIPYKMDFCNTQHRDVGYIFYKGRGTFNKKYFLINASIGITAEGNYLFNNPTRYLKWLKESNTSKAIIFTVIKTLLSYRNQPVHINSKESGSVDINLTNLGIVKNPNFSGNLSYGSSPIYDNGLLEIHLCSNMNIFNRLNLLWSLEKRKFHKIRKVVSWNTKEITITACKPFNVEYDGEVINTDYAKFGVLQKHIRVCQ